MNPVLAAQLRKQWPLVAAAVIFLLFIPIHLLAFQPALHRYQEALALWPKDDHHLRPYTLHNLGVLYARLLHDGPRGEELLLEAQDAWLPGDQAWKARSLSQLGRLAYEQRRLDEAGRYFSTALDLRRDNDRTTSD